MTPKPFESIDLQGFRYDDSQAGRWELVRELEYASLQQLLKKFRQEWRWWIKKPMGWARDPERKESTCVEMGLILVLYSKGFHVEIRRHHNILGPHPARLFYHSHQDPALFTWVAVAQLEALWYSDERILRALNNAVRNKEFWHSDKSSQTLVVA